MTINGIQTDNINQVQPAPNINKMNEEALKIGDKSDALKRADKLEISEDAKRMQLIQNRIETGFYNRADTMKAVARSIDKAFPKE